MKLEVGGSGLGSGTGVATGSDQDSGTSHFQPPTSHASLLGLSVLERGELLARHKAAYEALHPDTRRGVAGGRASGAARGGRAATAARSLVAAIAATMRRSPRTIEREIQIGTQIAPDVRARLHGTALDSRTTELLALARLPEAFQRQVVDRLIAGDAPSVEAARLSVVAETMRRTRQAAPTSTPPASLPEVLVVEPPWPEAPDAPGAAAVLAEIRALPVPQQVAPDAVLFLWTPGHLLRQAFACLDAWGFAEKSMLTWVKADPTAGAASGQPAEHCLVAVRGRPNVAVPEGSRAIVATMPEGGGRPAAPSSATVVPTRQRPILPGVARGSKRKGSHGAADPADRTG